MDIKINVRCLLITPRLVAKLSWWRLRRHHAECEFARLVLLEIPRLIAGLS